MTPVKCNHSFTERTPLLPKRSIALHRARMTYHARPDKAIVDIWKTFAGGVPGARPPLPRRAKSWHPASATSSRRACEGCTVVKLYTAEGVEEEVVEERLGPQVDILLPPPVQHEGCVSDVEAQVTIGEQEGRRSRFVRFWRGLGLQIQDLLGSRETMFILVVGTIIFAMFGLMVCRVIALERQCPRGTGLVAGSSAADGAVVCKNVFMRFVTYTAG